MKMLVSLIVLTAASGFAAESGAMTDSERAFLLEQLEQSKKNMLASIEAVTAAQWRFKPAPKVWSVAECAEHIILAEGYLFGAAQQSLKTPAGARLESANSEADHKLVAMLQVRSQKATAPEPIVPAGKFETPADAAREFTERRNRTIAYVKTTQDELRAHSGPGPIGQIDSYQVLLLLAAHSARHTAQIREVQSNAAYPKSSAQRQFLLMYELSDKRLDQLKPEQQALLQEHGKYIVAHIQNGSLKWGGRTLDAINPRGFAEMQAASEAEVRDFVSHDPSMKSGIMKCTIEPFSEIATR